MCHVPMMAAQQLSKGTNSNNPKKILIFSGKRKSGKDYIANELQKRLGSESCIIKLSGPIKSHWIKALNLDSEKLFGDQNYKEDYRAQMVKWGEDIRNKDYGYFCRAAIEMYNALDSSIWIISDSRRKSDLQWFAENYIDKCKTIRILASENTRKQRGWSFTKGIDDAETECDLDDFRGWDLQLSNENKEDIDHIVEQILLLID